jgi:hypothetical protein
MDAKPVFFDETGKRWRIVRFVLIVGTTALLLIPILLVLSIITTPVIPELLIQQHARLAAPAAARGNVLRRHYRQSKDVSEPSVKGDTHAPPPVE